MNADLTPPSNTFAAWIPLSFKYLTEGSPKVYWIDNQILDQASNEYIFLGGMPAWMTLAVPKVVRFLYTFDRDHTDDMCDAQADDCGDDPPEGGGPCTPGYGEALQIGACYAAPAGSGIFLGQVPTGFAFGFCPGPVYTTTTDPCGWVLQVYTYTGSVFFEGPLGDYHPTQAEKDLYKLPSILGYACCAGSSSPPPSPPPPPPPGGCGDEGGGG
jgi:hypothetical protein